MQREIALVDRGRGPQLSTSRITVHDLVPYFQDGCSDDEIIRWIPSLSHEEIDLVRCYYRQHKDELDDYERRVQAHRAEQIRLQRLRFPEPEGSRRERLAHLRELLLQQCQENKSDRARG
jgi:uncharacterized protein (DUF433 family)